MEPNSLAKERELWRENRTYSTRKGKYGIELKMWQMYGKYGIVPIIWQKKEKKCIGFKMKFL